MPNTTLLQSCNRMYCFGIGGVGVSGVARILLARGIEVVGFEPNPSPLTADVERDGGKIFQTFDPAQLDGIEGVVYSDAWHDHPGLATARKQGIPCWSFAEGLGQLMSRAAARIAISGTNGKSTTTALTGLLLANAKKNPTVFVGSRVAQFAGNVRIGSPRLFVAEADEYRDHYHQLQPTILTITNIEADHLDYFKTAQAVNQSFQTMISKLGSDGQVVANLDDPTTRQVLQGFPRLTTFGTSPGVDLQLTDQQTESGRQHFSLIWQGRELGKFTVEIPGDYNLSNIAAAVATALRAGAKPDSFSKTLADFHGVWRRFEILNAGAAVTIVNDYAHHPTAVRGVLEGGRAFYPGRRILAVFQPHHHHRLASLFPGFVNAFQAADYVLLTDVFAVPGRDQTPVKTSQDLAAALQAQGRAVSYAATLEDTKNRLRQLIQPGDVVIVMGAGDIWKVGVELAKDYAK